MTKYKELAQANQIYVNKLRKERAQVYEMHTLHRKEVASGDWDDLTYTPQDIADVELPLNEAIDGLERFIEEEYGNVPFRSARNAGVSAFWREVGGYI